MTTIQLPQPTEPDVYSFGFDTALNRVPDSPLDTSLANGIQSSVVFDSLDPTATANLSFGSVVAGTQNSMYIVDPSKGMWMGNALYASAPFRVNMNGEMSASSGVFSGTITATAGTIGGFTVGADYIKDAADSMGLASTVTGGDDVRFWAGSTFANRATAPFRVTEAGAVTATSVTLSTSVAISGIANNSSTDISLLGFSQNLSFTSTSATQVNWTSGTIALSNGRTFAISSGNTGIMAALTYIYLDTGVSTTVLQTTTTYSTAQGANKIIVAIGQNNTTAASVIPYGGGQPILDGGVQIAALSIVAGSIAAATITAAKMNVAQLSAIAVDAGSLTAGSISVVSGGNTIGFTPSGTNAIFSGTTGTPQFKVTPAGAVTASNITVTGGSISSTPISSIPNNSSTDISLMNFSHNLAFTSASATQINWSSGTIVMSNGRTFSISSGNTGSMAAATYIYLDTGVSSTVLQTTTTYSTATGANKILIATAQNNTVAASCVPFGGGQPVLDGVGNIAALSITAASIAASTITGGNIATMNISGKNATFDTGSIGGFTMAATTLTATNLTLTSGAANTANINVGTGSNLAGMNSGNAGSDIAFWSGSTFANRATAPFRVDLAGNLTATSATISGYLVTTKGNFGGDGSDGALSITSGTTTVSIASAAFLIKNYSSISITSTGTLAFSNPGTGGSVVVLKSSGAVTLTSSSAPMIDCSNTGAAGGAGRTGAAGNGNNGTPSTAFLFVSCAYGALGTDGGGGGNEVDPAFTYPRNTTSYNSIFARYPLITAGGGGGGAAIDVGSGTAGAGGRGGGGLILECAGAFNFTTANGISIGGTVGAASSGNTNAGGGGGGGGGFASILYNTLTAASGTVTVTGGAGGAGQGGSTNSGGRGAGGAGTNGSAYSGNTGGAGGNGMYIMEQNKSFA